jgi:hypothetical protein
MLAELMFCLFAERRERFLLRIIPTTLLFLALPYFVDYFVPWLSIGEWFTFSFLLEFILSMLIMWFCFNFTWQQVLYFGSAAYAIEHLFSAIAVIVQSAFLSSIAPASPVVSDLQQGMEGIKEMDGVVEMTGMGGETTSWLWLRLGIMLAVYILCYFVFVRQIRRVESGSIKSVYICGISIVTTVFVNVLNLYLLYRGFDVWHKVYDIIVCVLLLSFQRGLVHISELVKRNETMKVVLKLKSDQQKMTKENIDLINIKCHDLKHQIAALRKMPNDETKEKALKEVEHAVMLYESLAKTGNDTLDVILSDKKLICDKYGIRFSFIVDGESLSFMQEEDIYSLFGNALDNAIESLLPVEDKDKRSISMKVVANNKMLSIHFDNYCDKSLTFRDALPVTTKADKNYHGFGMLSIDYIVKKYKGTLTVGVVNDMFNLNILIPLPQERAK